MKPPIYDMLIKYVAKQRIKFTSPGHKGRIMMKSENLCSIDVEDIPRFDEAAGSEDIRQKQCVLSDWLFLRYGPAGQGEG